MADKTKNSNGNHANGIASRLNRRRLLAGSGALVASMGAVSLGALTLDSVQAAESTTWDLETDILVVGSGAAGCAAAVTANQNGDEAMVVEKAPIAGGTAAKSAGVLWIPNNFTLKAKGIDDRKDDCVRYMARFSHPERYDGSDPNLGVTAGEYQLLEAFYDNSSPALDSLRSNGDLRVGEWRMAIMAKPATDYLDNVPENKTPTGRPVGPLKADGSMGDGAELMDQLTSSLERRGVPILTGHQATRLIMNPQGRAIGLECDVAGDTVRIHARKAVIFGTGGYAHNTDFIDRYQRSNLFGACAMPWSTGDFISIGGAAGARMGDLSTAWRSQVLLEEALQARTTAAGVFYPPGDSMVQVNRHGKRAVNEKRNYNDRTEVHRQYDSSRAEFPNLLMFMIYDQRTAEAFANNNPLPATPTGASHVLSGSTFKELAANIQARLAEHASRIGGFSLSEDFAENLEATIKRFNGFAKTGVDEDFQRGAAAYDTEWMGVFSVMQPGGKWPAPKGPNNTMYPFRNKGPYYAIILAGGALDTSGGPAIDASARVLDTRDQPIPGLYGAGNCIASPSSEAYFGAGHTLGMATTFGYIAANHAHKQVADQG
jgi:hypothetical protein